MAAVTICNDFGVPKSKVFYSFRIYLSWSDGIRCHDLVFWMLSFKPSFSFSPFTFIKRLLSFSSLYSVRVVSFAYLRLLIFLLTILIPTCASPSPAFLMMYSTYKLNRQGDNIPTLKHFFPNFEPVSCSMSSSNFCFLTHIQVSQETGKVIWYSPFFKNFPVCCDPHSQRL